MPEALKILGQQQPATGYTAGTIFTVPAGHSYVVSSLVCCNTTGLPGADRLIRVFARPGGVATSALDAIAYDVKVGPGETVPLALGMTFGATDVLTVESDLGGVTFTAFGSDVT